MRTFKGNKSLTHIESQCKQAGIHFNDYLLRTGTSDYVVITTIKDDNYSGQVLYNTFNGTFFGTTPDGTQFDSRSTEHEHEPWFQQLLEFFYEAQ